MTKYTALIAGATGAASTRLVETLLADENWSVVGISRHPPEISPNKRLRYIRADLLDAQDTRIQLANETSTTHLVYTSRAPFKEGGVEDVESNVAMLANALDAIETTATNLQHVHLVEGAKWYGIHLGPGPTPAREDAPRHMPPNFYYDQQDFLAARQKQQPRVTQPDNLDQTNSLKPWTWSASRPNLIYDFAPQRPRNIVSVIGAWAAISKELGLPLDFPGKQGCYDAICDLTDARQLARSIKWMMTSPEAHNQAFNVTDGDVFRWRQMWKRVADHFGLETGVARNWTLGTWMADKQPIWEAISKKHNLVEPRLDQIAPWSFADFVFHQNYDVMSIMTKIRLAGFHDTVASEDNLIAHLKSYQDAGILPR